jgi:hypothetical protein
MGIRSRPASGAAGVADNRSVGNCVRTCAGKRGNSHEAYAFDLSMDRKQTTLSLTLSDLSLASRRNPVK